jgi:hypothetical protein
LLIYLKHKFFYSNNFGVTFNRISSHRCSSISASEDLQYVICINGDLYSQNHITYSYDKGLTWQKSEDSKAKWSGIVTNSDFSTILAIKHYSMDYAWHSKDKGKTFSLICRNELNKWGNVCASRDLETIMITDAVTKNAHVSTDKGHSWAQIFNSHMELHSNATTNGCSISWDGYTFGLAYSSADTYISHGCNPDDDYYHCRDTWIHQEIYKKSKDYHTTGIAISKFGKYFYTVDSTKNEIVRAEMEN